MKSKTAFKSIKEFLFQENKVFIIPNYQRGYKWAVKDDEKKDSAVEKLIDDLKNAINSQEYFLQGVTVSETAKNEIILIDGQQRTTTLYLLLWCLENNNIKTINLKYDIREQSKDFIQKLKEDGFDYENFDIENKSQDVYYFKKAIEQINIKLSDIDNKSDFYEFILDKVKILYIIIDLDKATNTFTMMNGNKATMLKEELIKSEMLRKVSLPEIKQKQVSSSVDENLLDLKEIITQDWETNALRSRYAREWDKWLYWWNQKDVKDFFEIENPMGLLLSFFIWTKKSDNKNINKFSFDDFRNFLTENGRSEKCITKLTFKELRDLQKSFEDVFNKPKIHNYLKMSLICSNGMEDRFNIINYFIGKKNEDSFKDDYAKWRLVGATHLEITNPQKSTSEQTKENRSLIVYNLLSKRYVYWDENDLEFNDERKEKAFKQLLRLNVEMDNEFNRKFDFSIWSKKSLEHIFPKSRKNEIKWSDNISVHCIGNLVLLYGNDNSSFGKLDYEDKKEKFFNFYVNSNNRIYRDSIIKSNMLLHTVSVFSNKQWNSNEIEENQNKFLNRFQNDYCLTSKNNNNE